MSTTTTKQWKIKELEKAGSYKGWKGKLVAHYGNQFKHQTVTVNNQMKGKIIKFSAKTQEGQPDC